MSTVLLAQTDTSCLHCVIHTMIAAYMKANPEFTRDEVVSCLMAVTAEFMVAVSKNSEDLKTATEAFIEQVPNAVLIALESIPTSGRTQ